MTILAVYREDYPIQPLKLLSHAEDIISTLAETGIGYERWEASSPVAPGAPQEEVLAAYQSQINRLKTERGYITEDVLSMDRKHPQKDELRNKFLMEHTHGEDEVRFFVAGRGLFSVHIAPFVYCIMCQRNDLISVPAGAKHWFDMGESPEFVAIRLFNNPEGWVAEYTGDHIADGFPRLEDFV